MSCWKRNRSPHILILIDTTYSQNNTREYSVVENWHKISTWVNLLHTNHVLLQSAEARVFKTKKGEQTGLLQLGGSGYIRSVGIQQLSRSGSVLRIRIRIHTGKNRIIRGKRCKIEDKNSLFRDSTDFFLPVSFQYYF